MAYQLQHRRAKAEQWSAVNPILADGEVGYIIPETSVEGSVTVGPSAMYKIGDGKTHWNDLPIFGFSGNITDLESPLNVDLKDEVVNKKSLVEKFEKVDTSIKNLTTDNLTQKENITKLTEVIGSNEADAKSGIQKEIDDIKKSINDETTGVPVLNTKVQDLNKEVFGETPKSPEEGETYLGLKDRVTKLEDTHVAITQENYDNLKLAGGLKEGSFYYIYEESKQ